MRKLGEEGNPERASKMEQGRRKLCENGTFDANLLDEKLGVKAAELIKKYKQKNLAIARG